MKILVTNNTLGNIPGGSEWHAHELCLALKRKGCDVHAYSPTLGWFAENLKKEGVDVFSNPPEGDYDLILASHLSTINSLNRKKTRGKLVQICHGVYPSLEQPSSKIDHHVAISEEVKQHLKIKGFESTIIFNGVDHSRYKPSEESGSGVVSMCQGELANKMIKNACNELNVGFTELNKFKSYRYDLYDVIPKFDVVVSLGRGAYEAMACNKKLLVLDSRHYVSSYKAIGDGIASLENVDEFMKNNCSGRSKNLMYSQSDVTAAIKKLLSSQNPNLRGFSESNLNIDLQADKYISIV